MVILMKQNIRKASQKGKEKVFAS